RGLGVLVDRHDRLGRLHACAVLDRPGDPGGDVELRRDRDTGLADLAGVRVPAGVDRGAGGTHGSAERVGELLYRTEVAGGAATTGDHDRGLGQLRATGGGLLVALHDLGGRRLLGQRHGDGLVRRL